MMTNAEDYVEEAATKSLPFHQSLAILAQFQEQYKSRFQLDQYRPLKLQLYL